MSLDNLGLLYVKAIPSSNIAVSEMEPDAKFTRRIETNVSDCHAKQGYLLREQTRIRLNKL